MARQQSNRSRGAAGAGTTEESGVKNQTTGMKDQAAGMKDQTTDKAKELAHEAQDKAKELAHEAQEKAGQAAHAAGEKASEIAHKAERAAESEIEHRKQDVAHSIHVFADALRLGAERIRERGDGASTTYVTRVADRVDGVSTYLERHDVSEMAREVEGFARRHTGAFLGGAFALGLIGARFAKSSGERSAGLPGERGAGLPREGALEHRPPSHQEMGRPGTARTGGGHG